MVANKSKSERGRFLCERGVELLTAEFHLGLANGRDESAPAPESRAPARLFDQAPMEIKNFSDAHLPHDIRRL
ncbi:hypothetical protein GGP66_003497 [Salinibacter ruber]|jgi:hypothetical protein|uniref:Uncharacterized protein n=1 Tax=Salinibacter ruber TaxID=146919 RepID=A0A9X2ZPX6_9BACT|nr:hypothetical protein [Salinibacter ruber]MCS3860160.1 hypothetical protein [Salinibacter ruber]MCS3866982.1 hypothetical protein [Salinibacter ruber]MCS4051346.1 hypothetical protein [Salinibacter ruber]MCS4152160.1 hypothetical protein [Salinibacter ruber]